MSVHPTPADALSPEAFYSLYHGALAIPDEHQRRQACYLILLMGRLGLQSDELLHLHEGWIDWRRGEISVPARDPCACQACWERARVQQHQGDGRSLEDIIAADFWSPPGENGDRTVAFGWSPRLTGAIDGVLDRRDYLDVESNELGGLLAMAASHATNLDPEQITFRALRASAIDFLARAGFGPRRLADIFAVDERTAGAFARVGGGELRNHLYQALDEAPPRLCGPDSPFRLVCDPTALDREPFNPVEYDADWRAERASRSEPRERNPRPPAPPQTSDFDPAEHLKPREPAGDSGTGIVAESLYDWVQGRERTHRRERAQPTESSDSNQTGSAESASAGQADEVTDSMGDKVTEPVEFSLSTRFVATTIESGRPRGGIVALGQAELLLLVRDETGAADSLLISLDQITGIAVDYVPDPLEGMFEQTVGVSFEQDGETEIAVCELPGDVKADFLTSLSCHVLSDQDVLVIHPSHQNGNITSQSPETRLLEVEPGQLAFVDPANQFGEISIRLLDVVHIEETSLSHESTYHKCLAIWHLDDNGTLLTTEVHPLTESKLSILKGFLGRAYRSYQEAADETPLSIGERDVLEALHTADEGRDLVSILDRDPDELANLLDALQEKEMIDDSGGGVALTAKGYFVVGEDDFETIA